MRGHYMRAVQINPCRAAETGFTAKAQRRRDTEGQTRLQLVRTAMKQLARRRRVTIPSFFPPYVPDGITLHAGASARLLCASVPLRWNPFITDLWRKAHAAP